MPLDQTVLIQSYLWHTLRDQCLIPSQHSQAGLLIVWHYMYTVFLMIDRSLSWQVMAENVENNNVEENASTLVLHERRFQDNDWNSYKQKV
jgi:hypothetical protein